MSVAAHAAAVVVVSSLPHGMVQAVGESGATDSFSLTNVGDATASVAVAATANATFFTYAPSVVTLAPGATAVIGIQAFPQSTPGLLKGTILIPAANTTVEVKLLTTARPPTAVSIVPPVTRAEFRVVPPAISPAPCAPASGCVQFTNNSSVAVDALVTTDADWVHLLQDSVTFQPGETKSVCFDSCVFGATNAKISVTYLNGTKQATASVPAVIFSQPTLNSGAPPPLQPGEVALFIPALANRSTAIGDLVIGAKSGTTLPANLQVYLQNSFFSIPQPDSPALVMPGLLKNFFASSATAGTIQIRGSDVAKVAVVATQVNPSSAHSHRAIVPVLRSDLGIAAGDRLILTGATKQPGIQTDLYIQEMKGFPASVRVENLDAQGNVISARPDDPVAAFGLLAIPDAAATGAAALRITNTLPGFSAIGAYALVGNPSTGAAAAITDPINDSPADEQLLVPLVDIGPGSQRSVFTSNRQQTSSSEAVEIRSVLRRRSSIAGVHRDPASTFTTYTLGPFATLEFRILSTSTGYALVDALPRSVSAGGRSTRTAAAELFVTRLPALPVSSAIGAGGSKRFAGVEDTSASATSLIVMETTAQPATVRVTLRYTFVASSLLSANAISSKEYPLQPSQYLRLGDVVSDVIGSARQAFGDLHGVTMDVEVINGSGRVLALLESLDTASGDVLLRAD